MGTSNILQMSPRYLKGVGPRRAEDLQRAGLSTVEDLLCRLPNRYEDRGRFEKISNLKLGESVSVSGEILSCHLRSTRRAGFKIFEILVSDDTGAVCAIWFNQPFLKGIFRPHQQVVLFGKAELRKAGGVQFSNPQYEVITHERRVHDDTCEEEGVVHTGRIVPIYEKVGTMTSKMQRKVVYVGLESLPTGLEDFLPMQLLKKRDLPDRRLALREAHFPRNGTSIDVLNRFRSPAQVRLIFEEFFFFQLGLALRRKGLEVARKPRPICVDDAIRKSALGVLPFKLTGNQKQALKEIVSDMQRPQPMNRLLQGDVGSGKTIVALLSALVAMENDLQVAVMAPTEILAEQHFLYLRRLLERSRFRIVLLAGKMTVSARREIYADLASGATALVVGTQALVQDPVKFRELGLVIIDEQHRFGVVQRATLRLKGLNPDVLVMTATPIPRTLSLTAYGDLDQSTLREFPPGRRPIKTVVKSEASRNDVYGFVKKHLSRGRQAYVVYPLVEESEKVALKGAKEMVDYLAHEVFQEYRVALLHGRMKQELKNKTMLAFSNGEIDLLVTTTVVEVGVDVSNASIMVIEHADRFGLAQLHQLRGRVGRGKKQSYCIFLYRSPLSDGGRARLKAAAETNDGFLIAERDLELRGPGDFFGTRQWGMPMLRVGDLLRDRKIMEDAREDAQDLLSLGPLDESLQDFVEQTWAHRFGMVGIG